MPNIINDIINGIKQTIRDFIEGFKKGAYSDLARLLIAIIVLSGTTIRKITYTIKMVSRIIISDTINIKCEPPSYEADISYDLEEALRVSSTINGNYNIETTSIINGNYDTKVSCIEKGDYNSRITHIIYGNYNVLVGGFYGSGVS